MLQASLPVINRGQRCGVDDAGRSCENGGVAHLEEKSGFVQAYDGWGGKRYYSLSCYLKNRFKEKVQKISVDAGFTCPNRDGTAGSGGCIFCSPEGSGEFAGKRELGITGQIMQGAAHLKGKYGINRYIVYFQAFSNTYAPVGLLKERYLEALSFPGVAGLAIATRPDCLGDDVVCLLSELAASHFIWVELGLQTISSKTAIFINRGYSLDCFEKAADALTRSGVPAVCHLILGLPHESREMMLESVRYIAARRMAGIKLHMLYVADGTRLARIYKDDPFRLPDKDEYISLVADCIELLPPDTVVHRLTGDGPARRLIAPLWSTDKIGILNGIDRELEYRDSWQGKQYRGTGCGCKAAPNIC